MGPTAATTHHRPEPAGTPTPLTGTVLVTGAAGFIGSHVAEALLRRGNDVVGIDNFDPFYDRARKERNARAVADTARDLGRRFELLHADITDPAATLALFRDRAPRGVVHLAAKAGVRPSIQDPAGYAHANVTGTANVLQAAHAADARSVVIASSSSVYGNLATVPFREDADVSEPISPYAATKRACELLCFTHHHLTRQPVAALRFFTVFGPRQRPDLAIGSFLARVSRGEEIVMFGDGSTSRDYTFIDDIARGVLAALDHAPAHGFRVWNLGNSEPVSLRDMVAAVARVVGREARVRVDSARPGDVERTFADPARARAELGFAPGVPFEEGLRRQLAWMRAEGLA